MALVNNLLGVLLIVSVSVFAPGQVAAVKDNPAAERQESAGTKLCREGKVSRDQGSGMYVLRVRGFSFPFLSDPCQAANVAVRSGEKAPEVLAELLLSRKVTTVRLVSDSRDGEQGQKATDEILQYLNLGRAGDTRVETVSNEAEVKAPVSGETVVYMRGPAAGAREDSIKVTGNQIDIQGSSEEGLVRAADRLVLELAAVFCGSRACSDPVACAAGKKCGCAKRRRN